MNKLKFSIAILALLTAGTAQAALSVFACEPEWAALAEELGGDDVNVYSVTTAMQDPHRIEARPSLIAKTRRAGIAGGRQLGELHDRERHTLSAGCLQWRCSRGLQTSLCAGTEWHEREGPAAQVAHESCSEQKLVAGRTRLTGRLAQRLDEKL